LHLTGLQLTDFRNYREATLAAPPGLILARGANGAGKTNLLEAIYFLAVCRSFRTGRDRDLTREGQAGFALRARVAAPAGEEELELSYAAAQGKRAVVNGEALPRLLDYVGTFAAVAFVPEDMELAQGEPSVRRRFLDMWLGQQSREYLYDLQRYQEVLVRRNSLLAHGAPRAEREPYDNELIVAGSALTAARARAAAHLIPAAGTAYAELAPAGESFEVAYEPSVPAASTDKAEVETKFREALARVARAEEERRQTLVGPHRDDLALLVAGRDARRFASEGQQRTAALALRLAQYRLLAAQRGDPPILLLDDVTSALDAGRQARLFEAAQTAPQVWLTAPEKPTSLKPNAEYYIANGEISY